MKTTVQRSFQAASDRDTEEDPLLPLHADARLRLNEGACLPMRNDFGGCRACQSACPASVLDVSVERVRLADGCLDCGRCAAACPTGALSLPGFDLDALPDGRGPLPLECAKVPLAARQPGAASVPCLGGLSAGRLAALHERSGERGVELIDRGWCATCVAGGGECHPAAAALDAVVTWLDAVGDTRCRPRLRLLPLPVQRMPARIPTPRMPVDDGPALSRRQFFRTLATDPVGRERRSTAMGENGRAAFPPAARRESPERRRQLDAFGAAAARSGRSLPPELYPQLTLAGECVDHRVCVGACPTGAIEVVASGDGAALVFASSACIACGACTRACPESALAIAPTGGVAERQTLVRHQRRTCRSCGESFVPRDAEAECATCGKARRFMGDAMSKLYGVRG